MRFEISDSNAHEYRTGNDHARPPPEVSLSQAIHQVVQFARVVRYRKNIVVLALIVAALLGGLYYATATRYYEAKASLLILQTGTEMLNTTMKPEGADAVADAHLRAAAHQRRGAGDGACSTWDRKTASISTDVPPDRWLEMLRRNLSVSTVRRTNLLELSYRSRNPQSAVVIVNAVVRAYLEFMEKTHKGTAGEIIAVLTREKTEPGAAPGRQGSRKSCRFAAASATWASAAETRSCTRSCSGPCS